VNKKLTIGLNLVHTVISRIIGGIKSQEKAWDGKEFYLLDFDTGLGNISGPGRPGNEL